MRRAQRLQEIFTELGAHVRDVGPLPCDIRDIAYSEIMGAEPLGSFFMIDLATGNVVTVHDNWADFGERWATERDRQDKPVHYLALANAMRRAGLDVDLTTAFSLAAAILQWYWERYTPQPKRKLQEVPA